MPFTYEAAGVAKKAMTFAISSGLPIRRAGICSKTMARNHYLTIGALIGYVCLPHTHTQKNTLLWLHSCTIHLQFSPHRICLHAHSSAQTILCRLNLEQLVQ